MQRQVSLILVILVVVFCGGVACAGAQAARTVSVKPAPVIVRSLMFEDLNPYQASIYRSLAGAKHYSAIEERFEEYTPVRETQRPLMVRALSNLAGQVKNSSDGSVESIIDRYERRLDRIGRGYEKVENFMVGSLGLQKNDFRQGLGVTAIATATTVGAIHALAPTYTSGDLLGTGFRAGYDLSQLDDPRMVLAYESRAKVMLSRNGIGGSYGTNSGIVYTADLNIRKQIAAANLSLPAGVTFATEYEHPDREVKGFVSMGF